MWPGISCVQYIHYYIESITPKNQLYCFHVIITTKINNNSKSDIPGKVWRPTDGKLKIFRAQTVARWFLVDFQKKLINKKRSYFVLEFPSEWMDDCFHSYRIIMYPINDLVFLFITHVCVSEHIEHFVHILPANDAITIDIWRKRILTIIVKITRMGIEGYLTSKAKVHNIY